MVSTLKRPNHNPSTPPRSIQSKITNYQHQIRKRVNHQESPKARARNTNSFQALTEEEEGFSNQKCQRMNHLPMIWKQNPKPLNTPIILLSFNYIPRLQSCIGR